MKTYAIAGCWFLAMAGLAFGQAAQPVQATNNSVPIGNAGTSYYSDPYGASTAIEGLGRGVANVLHSSGQLAALSGQAALSYAQADRLRLDNAVTAAQTYMELRRMNRELQAELRGRRMTQEELIRISQFYAPRRLSPGELDASNGRVGWPVVLRADDYAPYRAELDRLFAEKASVGTLTSEDYLRIFELINGMTQELRDNIVALPPVDYVSAKRFLNSLAMEARAPSQNLAGLGMVK